RQVELAPVPAERLELVLRELLGGRAGHEVVRRREQEALEVRLLLRREARDRALPRRGLVGGLLQTYGATGLAHGDQRHVVDALRHLRAGEALGEDDPERL